MAIGTVLGIVSARPQPRNDGSVTAKKVAGGVAVVGAAAAAVAGGVYACKKLREKRNIASSSSEPNRSRPGIRKARSPKKSVWTPLMICVVGAIVLLTIVVFGVMLWMAFPKKPERLSDFEILGHEGP